jgi:hypothetical protein
VRARLDLSPADRAELLLAPTLTLTETARAIGCGLTALRDAIRRGEIALPVLRVGSRVVVPTVAVRNLLGMEAAVVGGVPTAVIELGP